MSNESEIYAELARIGTATLSTQLVKKGIRRHLIHGARPLLPRGPRIAGPAYTMRLIPGREDVATAESMAGPSGFMAAVEAADPGSVLVIETQGAEDCGVLGDILADRLRIRGVKGAVTDGVMRDLVGLERVGWPIWAKGLTPPPSFIGLWFAGTGMPVGVGSVAVFPGDTIVADEDGAIVIPRAMVEPVLAGAIAQDAFEQWVIARVAEGRSVTGLYPPDAATLAEYERFKASAS